MRLDNFNKIYTDLLNDLHSAYPDKNIIITDEPSNTYLLHFIKNILPHIDNVSVKNYDYFKYKCGEFELVKKFKFKYLFLDNNKENIPIVWNYLQNLYVILYNLEQTSQLIEDNLKNNKNYNLIKLAIRDENYQTYLQNFLKIEKRMKPKGNKKKRRKNRKKKKEKKQIFKDPVLSSDEENENSSFPDLGNLDPSFIEN